MIVAAALFVLELADIARRELTSMETVIMTAIWGASTPCTPKELLFAMLLGRKAHRRGEGAAPSHNCIRQTHARIQKIGVLYLAGVVAMVPTRHEHDSPFCACAPRVF